jgi:hypothetical protein
VEVLELRISYFSYRDTLHASRDTNLPSTSVEDSLQISSFMQNKANVKIGKMNVSVARIKDYRKNNEQPTTNVIQNKPKQSQTKPVLSAVEWANFKRDLAKMGHHEPEYC